MALDLRGKTVVITGASSGIGRSCARSFAAAGCRLILAARRQDRLDQLAAEVRETGTDVLTATVDVRDRAAVEGWIGGLPVGWRDVDVLINNAGLSRGMEPLHEGIISDWEEMIDTNVKGLLYVTRSIVPARKCLRVIWERK